METARPPTLFLRRASGTLLKPNIKEIEVNVEGDPHESVTYTMPAPRAAKRKAAAVSSRRSLMSS